MENISRLQPGGENPEGGMIYMKKIATMFILILLAGCAVQGGSKMKRGGSSDQLQPVVQPDVSGVQPAAPAAK